MDQKRILLAGSGSGLWGIIQEAIEVYPDMELIGFCDTKLESANTHAESELEAAVRANNANVVILDLGARVVNNEGFMSENAVARTDLVRSILDRFPSLLVIVLSALGKRVVVHSAFHLNNPGVNQLLNAIRMCTAEDIGTIEA